MISSFRLVSFLFSLVLFLSVAATDANAQFKAGIQGTVTDQSGAVISDASVTLRNLETGQSVRTVASSGGFYRFSSLAPGTYSLEIEKDGFKKRIIESVSVRAEQIQGLDVVLEIGELSETVTVTSEELPLQTEDANIRKTLSGAEVLRLPQPGRDPYELARLAPGVFGTGARSASGGSVRLPNTSGPGGSNNSIFATENAQPISANGQRVSANNYQIDGTSVNSQTWGGAAVVTPSQESVKEVVVTSSTYSAEDGRNSGAQIKVVTQNGTNELHGSAFFKLNDPAMNAYNKMPRFVGNIDTGGPTRVNRKFTSYGGSLGGPIVKNRLFFFFAYEGLTENTTNVFNSLVETEQWRNSVIAARPNTVTSMVLSSGGVEPRILQTLSATCNGLFVPCQVAGGGMDLGSVFGSYGTYVPFSVTPMFDGIPDVQWAQLEGFNKFSGNQFNTRVDFQATDDDKLTFTSYFVPNKATTSDANSQSRPQSDITSERLTFALGFIYSRTLSPTMLNEARFNITRWGYDETKSNPEANLGLPRIEIEGFFGNRLRFGFPHGLNTPGIINEKQLDFRDTLTKIWGDHVLRFGGEYRVDLNSNGEVGGARPLYSFHRLWNFVNGTPIFESIAATLEGQPSPNNTKFSTSELAFFVQDDWKFYPNLTVNLGLRWSYFAPPTASDGMLGNLLLDENSRLEGARIITDKSLYNKDFNNFGPQIGFAWSPEMFENKAVLRGGFGIGYDRLPNALLANSRRNPPNGALFGICCGTSPQDGFGSPFVDGQITYVASSDGSIFGYPANPVLGGGTNPSTGLPNNGAVEIYGAPQDLPTAYVLRYSLEGQYELPGNMVATVGYQGSQGRHFVRILPLHVMAGNNPHISAAYFASPDVNSGYNALITRLQGRFADQFTFDTNYRWSKSIDTSSFESPCACTNQSYPVDQSEERGPSDFDVTHSFVASGLWDIPLFRNSESWSGRLLGGWQLNGIATWNGGFPWTPKLFGCLGGYVAASAAFCDPRPTGYNGMQPLDNSNDNFLQAGGIFPGGGPAYFTTSFNGFDPFANPPGIGRNRFRGPRYFSMDMSVQKSFRIGGAGFLKENASVDVRFNFFNLFNNLNLAPFTSNSGPTRVQLQEFGTATSALAGRVGEFQVRFSF